MYDYGWRSYMPDVGRWIQVDPLFNDLDTAIDFDQEDEDDDEIDMLIAFARKMEVGGGVFNTDNLNPYSYGYNNPVVYDDPDGRCPKCIKALLKTTVKSIAKGKIDLGEVYDAVDNVKTIINPNASLLDKGIAVFDLVSPVSSKEIKAANKLLDEGRGVIYKIPGNKLPSGKPYIGSADDLNKRSKTSKDGRDRTDAVIIGTYKKGDKKDRKINEQKAMDAEKKNQGIKPGQKIKDVLDNKREEISAKNRKKYGL